MKLPLYNPDGKWEYRTRMPADSANLNRALYSLRDLLSRESNRGRKTVPLSPESLDRLESMPGAVMRSVANQPEKKKAAAEPMTTEIPSNSVVREPAAEPMKTETTATPAAATMTGEMETVPGKEQREIEILMPEGETKREKLRNLFRMAKACEICRNMETLRDQLVFATGNPEAELMFVGEAPGAEEEAQKEPFVGAAGQKLNGIIQAMGLKREDLYISNIVKYRPLKGDGRSQGMQNRKPTPDEMGTFVKFILAEIDIVKPKAIVALGATAAEGLLGIAGSVGRMRNRFYNLDGIPVMVTYHPSYLLRSEKDFDGGKSKKRMVWEDILLVMEKIGMPVSEKQRGYFA
ncbi:MAG: uracil-DNA glycosylase [Verrucomicrobiales bacterium]|nr:uracil-DNA glycosylase [Verrucomicrobiales bacterium]